MKKILAAIDNPKVLVACCASFMFGFGVYSATDIYTFLSGYWAGSASVGALAFWLDEEDNRNVKSD